MFLTLDTNTAHKILDDSMTTVKFVDKELAVVLYGRYSLEELQAILVILWSKQEDASGRAQ
jgi:hypothetical protein